jgi:hypothetical protein
MLISLDRCQADKPIELQDLLLHSSQMVPSTERHARAISGIYLSFRSGVGGDESYARPLRNGHQSRLIELRRWRQFSIALVSFHVAIIL